MPAARGSVKDRESFLGKVFLLPSVVYIAALVAVPFVLAIVYSFTDITTGDPSLDYVGLRQYRAIFDDPTFWQSLRNTLLFTFVSMIFIIVLGKILAMILVADFRGKWFVRFLVLLPWTTPVALSTIAWLWTLDHVYSPIDWVLRQLGFLPEDGHMLYLAEPGKAMTSVIVVHVWRLVPLAAVIMLAGLASIPQDLNDAAKVDGAGWWMRYREVTFPLTLPVVAVAGLFGAISTFTDLSVVRVLTNGGPLHQTEVLASWAYTKGIGGGDLGQGAAIALFMFPVLLAGAIAILRSVRKMETM